MNLEAPNLEFRFEKCHGVCGACGFFGHGGGVCDKGLEVAVMATLPLVVLDMNSEMRRCWRSMNLGGMRQDLR